MICKVEECKPKHIQRNINTNYLHRGTTSSSYPINGSSSGKTGELFATILITINGFTITTVLQVQMST